MRHYTGERVLPLADELAAVYTEVFSEPPWSREPAALRRFRERLAADALRPGFHAVVAEESDGAAPSGDGASAAPGDGAPRAGGIDGFATGWTTGAPFRSDRSYGAVAEQLGPDRVAELLTGALEVDELAVRARARGRGLGQRLVSALAAHAPDGRAWLLTARWATDTVAFYRRIGWHEVPPLPGTGSEVVVFLAPGHPGA